MFLHCSRIRQRLNRSFKLLSFCTVKIMEYGNALKLTKLLSLNILKGLL